MQISVISTHIHSKRKINESTQNSNQQCSQTHFNPLTNTKNSMLTFGTAGASKMTSKNPFAIIALPVAIGLSALTMGCQQATTTKPTSPVVAAPTPAEENANYWANLTAREKTIALQVEDAEIAYEEARKEPIPLYKTSDLATVIGVKNDSETALVAGRLSTYAKDGGSSATNISPDRTAMNPAERNGRMLSMMKSFDPASFKTYRDIEDAEEALIYTQNKLIQSENSEAVLDNLKIADLTQRTFAKNQMSKLNNADDGIKLLSSPEFMSPEKSIMTAPEKSNALWIAMEKVTPRYYEIALEEEDIQGAAMYMDGKPYPLRITGQFESENGITDPTEKIFVTKQWQLHNDTYNLTGDTFSGIMSPKRQDMNAKAITEYERFYTENRKLLKLGNVANMITLTYKCDPTAVVNPHFPDLPVGYNIVSWFAESQKKVIVEREGLTKPYPYMNYPPNELIPLGKQLSKRLEDLPTEAQIGKSMVKLASAAKRIIRA